MKGRCRRSLSWFITDEFAPEIGKTKRRKGKTMAIIVTGRLAAFVFLVLTVILFYIFMYVAKRGWKVSIRTFPAVAAIPEAVGRAAEMGKPIYYSTGYAMETISNPDQGPQTLAGISILSYVTRLSARSGVKIAYFTDIADSLPLVEETMRNAYLEEGKPEDFDPMMIQFQSGQSPYLTATLGYMQRERPAANIFMGGFYYEAVVMGEAGNIIGAMQISGTANTHQMPFFIATCDYAMISEELYAASAQIAQNPDILGCIKGEDLMKLLILAILGVGFVLSWAGITFLANILQV